MNFLISLLELFVDDYTISSHFKAQKVKVKVKSLSHDRLFATPWTVAYQASPSMGFPRQEYWSGVPLPSPKNSLGVLKNTNRLFCLKQNIHFTGVRV